MAAPDMKGILLFFEMVITFVSRSGMGEGALDVVLPIPIVFIRPASTIIPANGLFNALERSMWSE